MKLIDHVNQQTMKTPSALRRYAQAEDVWPPEEALWQRLRPEVRGQPILDLGVGGGRTVAPLRSLSEDYTGLDYTKEMIDICRDKFPGVRFVHGDARDLSSFPADHYALVTFTCNGLDMVGHEDRLRVLDQVLRVLRPGGAFVFTSNNQNSAKHWEGLVLPPFHAAKNPVRLAVRVTRFAADAVASALNYHRRRGHDLRQPAYSVIRERSHNYGVMTYYISLANARRQLADAGFAPEVEAFDLSGQPIAQDSHDVSICYLARKPGRTLAMLGE